MITINKVISPETMKLIYDISEFNLQTLPNTMISSIALNYLSKGTLLTIPLSIISISKSISFLVGQRILSKSKNKLILNQIVLIANAILQIPVYLAIATLSSNVQAVALGILLTGILIANLLSKDKANTIKT